MSFYLESVFIQNAIGPKMFSELTRTDNAKDSMENRLTDLYIASNDGLFPTFGRHCKICLESTTSFTHVIT